MKVCFKYLLVAIFFVKGFVSVPLSNDGGFVFPTDDDEDLNEDLNELLLTDEERRNVDFNQNGNNGLESGSYYQGDIQLLDDQKEFLESTDTDDGLSSRTGVLLESQRWPKNNLGKVIVPYKFKSQTDYTKAQQTQIRKAMDAMERYTCIRFVKRTTEEDYIEITDGYGCSSHLGKIGQNQEVTLQKKGCLSKGTIQHELIHALGYDHMHSHIDRDKFIEIKYSNINPRTIYNFAKVDPKKFGNFGTSYDFFSVMHYNSNAFSKNGEDTIVPKNSRYNKIIGQRIALSSGDARRINNMYKC